MGTKGTIIMLSLVALSIIGQMFFPEVFKIIWISICLAFFIFLGIFRVFEHKLNKPFKKKK